MRKASPLVSLVALAACSGAGSEPASPPPVAAVPSPPPPSAAPPAPPPPAAPIPTATAAVAAEPPKPVSPCPPSMALVPGGTYTMSPPKREVTVAPFCMDLSETTADEYSACVKAGNCNADNLKCAAQATYEASGMGNHPVVCVDFTQAETYCKAQHKRLASDEEWEWAARGGPAGHAYPWGDEPKGKACWSGDSPLTGTCAVGAYPAGDSPQGIHDLAGNVFEWTTSRLDKKGLDRVGRGGSWRDGVPEALKASRPGGFKVTYRCGFLGIRCVSEPAQP